MRSICLYFLEYVLKLHFVLFNLKKSANNYNNLHLNNQNNFHNITTLSRRGKKVKKKVTSFYHKSKFKKHTHHYSSYPTSTFGVPHVKYIRSIWACTGIFSSKIIVYDLVHGPSGRAETWEVFDEIRRPSGPPHAQSNLLLEIGSYRYCIVHKKYVRETFPPLRMSTQNTSF